MNIIAGRKALVLVPARACGRQEHRVARPSHARGEAQGLVHVGCPHRWDDAFGHGHELLGALANRDHAAALRGQGPAQQREVVALGPTAADQHEGPLEPVEPGQDRGDVGRLRVVVEANASALADQVHAVRQGSKPAQARDAGLVRDPEMAGGREREQAVDQVVATGERDLLAIEALVIAELEHVAEQARGRVALDQTQRRCARDQLGEHGRVGIVGREQGQTSSVEARERARLGPRVGVHARVAIDVIRRDVEDHRDGGRRRLGGDPQGLELVARALEHQRARPASPTFDHVEQELAERNAEVATDEGIEPASLEQRAGQRGHGALAVGPRDQQGLRHRWADAGDQPQREAQLAVQLRVRGHSLMRVQPRLRRHARAQDQQIERREHGVVDHRCAEVTHAALEPRGQAGDFGAQIVELDLDAAADQQLGRRDPALATADHESARRNTAPRRESSERSQHVSGISRLRARPGRARS